MAEAAEQYWWVPPSFHLALLTALVSTACWGSWSNTAKAAGDRMNFAHYYTDFCIGTVLLGVVFWLTLGGMNFGEPDVDLNKSFFALAAGAVFGVANLLLTTGIALAGLSIAFPLCIGTGLVLGTLLTYWVDNGRGGSPYYMFPGVFLALLGVVANSIAYGVLQRHRALAQKAGGDPDQPTTEDSVEAVPSTESSGAESSDADIQARDINKGSPTRNIILCIIGGLWMGCWAPLSAKSMNGEGRLSPYWAFVCFSVASLVVGLSIISGQQCGCSVMPRVGPVTGIREYFRIPPLLHGWGLLGGVIWAVGTSANLVSGDPLGFALSYALGQTAPVVAVLWGLIWYHEFDGAPPKAIAYLVAMFVFFIAAIALLCMGGQ